MVPPEVTPAVSIGLRNCYVARFGHPLKASKSPQQLSKAFEPQNPPQQLAKVSRLLCHGTSRGPTSCFYWASKLLRGTFWAASQAPQQLSKAFEPHINPPQQLSKASACFAMVPPEVTPAVSIGLRNCYVARFGHPLKASKAPQQLSKPLNRKTLRSSLRRRPACFAMVPY